VRLCGAGALAIASVLTHADRSLTCSRWLSMRLGNGRFQLGDRFLCLRLDQRPFTLPLPPLFREHLPQFASVDRLALP